MDPADSLQSLTVNSDDPDDGRVGALPHFASIVPRTLAHVNEQSSGLDHDHDDRHAVEDSTDRADRGPDSVDAQQAQEFLDQARARLAETPAEVIVTNHVMGLYELAAIHLSSDPPNLGAASLAIDAIAALVDGLGERLGSDFPTMRDALANIRLVFVEITRTTS